MAVTDATGTDRLEVDLATDGFAAAVLHRAPDGSVRWQHLPPEGAQDAFVSVELRAGEVAMTSWSGWRVLVDPVSGVVTKRDFTK
jgi:hypothetical protein